MNPASTKSASFATSAPRLRMTIGRKIALAVVLIVVLCVGTMAWVTSQNLNRGFLTYLDQLQLRELAPLRDAVAERYRQEGNFDWLRGNRQAMRSIVDRVHGTVPTVDEERQRRRQRRAERERPPPPPEFGPPDRPPRHGPPDAPPLPRADQAPLPDELPPPPAERAPRPQIGQNPQDPLGYGSRLSITDAQGDKVIGPRPPIDASVLPIMVDDKLVGRMHLARLDQISAATDATSAIKFVRGQMRDTAWIAAGLVAISILLAFFLARHFLRPIGALRLVTEKIARGQLAARAPVLGSDELSQLAQHVNQMAQALEQSEQQRRQMMADIAHELRTPLTVIRGEIEALLDGIRKLDSKAMESLHVEVLRLNKMIDDVHQLTLADVGDLHFQFQDVDLPAMLEPVLIRYQLRAANAKLSLSWQLPTEPLVIPLDAGRLTQVITNLLENSVRYTDPGGRIVFSMQLMNDWVHLQLDDSAPGVPAGTHARLFERLYRVDQARSRERGGSGLGLSICQALIQAHGGSIEALPSALGGVRMVLRLPLQKKA